MVTINRQLGKRLQNTSITDYGQGLNRIDMNMAKLDVQPIIVDNSIEIVGQIDKRVCVFDVISDPDFLEGAV